VTAQFFFFACLSSLAHFWFVVESALCAPFFAPAAPTCIGLSGGLTAPVHLLLYRKYGRNAPVSAPMSSTLTINM